MDTLFMALCTVVSAFVSHRFWDAQEAVRATQYVQFMKNVAITGGFLALFVAGSGQCIGIDHVSCRGARKSVKGAYTQN